VNYGVGWEDYSMNKYGPKAQEEVKKAVHEHKHHGKFQNRKQAVAVGLDKARRAGGKAPEK
jgi:hypothetical protein